MLLHAALAHRRTPLASGACLGLIRVVDVLSFHPLAAQGAAAGSALVDADDPVQAKLVAGRSASDVAANSAGRSATDVPANLAGRPLYPPSDLSHGCVGGCDRCARPLPRHWPKHPLHPKLGVQRLVLRRPQPDSEEPAEDGAAVAVLLLMAFQIRNRPASADRLHVDPIRGGRGDPGGDLNGRLVTDRLRPVGRDLIVDSDRLIASS